MIGRLLQPVAGRTTAGVSVSSDRVADLFGGQPTASGASITEDTALNISAVYCAVTLISNSLKTLPWFVYRRLARGGRDLATDHPVYKLLHRSPNPETTPSRFKKLLASWVLLWGNGRAEIERDGYGQPVALWPIHPSRCVTKRNSAGDIVHEVYNEDGSMVTLDDEDVFHVQGFSKDGLTGISVIGLARETLGLAVAAEEYGARFFANDATPRAVLEHPSTLTEEASQRLRKSWHETYGGANRHGVAILEEAMKLNVFGMPNEDAQFLQTRTFQVVEVARWFNIPPHKLKELSRATFSNIEHQSLEYGNDSVVPYAVDFEEEGDRKLFATGNQDLFCEFLVDAMLRADTQARNRSYEIQRRNGVLNADEWRRKENMNPLPGGRGEIYIVPANMKSVDQLAAEAAGGKGGRSSRGNRDADQRTAIARAHEPLLADTIGRMLTKEANAARRARKKSDDFGVWLDEFYAEHAVTFRSAIAPCVEALGGALRATLPAAVPDGRWDQFIGEFTARVTDKHCRQVADLLTDCREVVAGVMEAVALAEARAAVEELLKAAMEIAS